MRKISVFIANRHATSICLEEEFYQSLISIAREKNLSLNHLVSQIDSERKNTNLSSAIRIYILNHYKQELMNAKKIEKKSPLS